ncbi:hypothetical protein Tco_0809198 [Tanacetum coccineum]
MSRNCPVIFHVLFADDSLFFLKAKASKCDCLIGLIDQYCKASGQTINFSKSEVTFSPNTPMDEQQYFCNRTGSSKKMQGWKQRFLSQAGREVLIKSVIQAIPSYAMQCYMLPKGFFQKLLVHIKRFFRSGDAHERHIHWLSWDRICEPKDGGRLSFRDLSCFNLALLAKQGWRLITNPGSFWGRVLRGIYFPRSNFLTATKGSHPSWLWQSLLLGRDLLLRGIRWQVGSLWDVSKLNDAVLPKEVSIISQVSISKTWALDKLVWHYEAKGNYTVKSGYRQALLQRENHSDSMASSSSAPNKSFWKQLWNLKILPRVKFFCGRLVRML